MPTFSFVMGRPVPSFQDGDKGTHTQTYKASTMNASHHAHERIKENGRPRQLARDSTIVGGTAIMHHCKNE